MSQLFKDRYHQLNLIINDNGHYQELHQYHQNLMIGNTEVMINDNHHSQELYHHRGNLLIDNEDVMNDDTDNHQIRMKLFNQQYHNLHPHRIIFQVSKKLDVIDDEYNRQTLNNILIHQFLNQFLYHPIPSINIKYPVIGEDHYHLVSNILIIL
jgi:hypothetical protein